ncbi:MAG TPA: histidine phosphatase family protein [Candidatus Polarisedimenticolaceae bacterium]|nr:histidine phosphatase family protein [Candidatus Polarisedimenticolaceae bacterium]
MRTRIFLVRHGETTSAAEDRFAGSTDVELAETGRRQARALGRRLAHEALAVAYTSPMTRTRETARLILDGRDVETTVVPELREIDHGQWEGKSKDEVRRMWTEEFRAWEADPFTFAPSGGETGLEVLNRALPRLLAIAERHVGASVLVVSHKATIRLLVGHLLGFALRGFRDRLGQDPCALNVLDVQRGGEARLLLFNDVSHYEDLPGPVGSRLSPRWP